MQNQTQVILGKNNTIFIHTTVVLSFLVLWQILLRVCKTCQCTVENNTQQIHFFRDLNLSFLSDLRHYRNSDKFVERIGLYALPQRPHFINI